MSNYIFGFGFYLGIMSGAVLSRLVGKCPWWVIVVGVFLGLMLNSTNCNCWFWRS